MIDSRKSTVTDHVPLGRKAFPGRVGVSLNSVIRLKEIDNVIDKGVDLALVGTGDEAGTVIDTGKLGDPDRLAISGIVIVNVRLDTIHAVLVDVQVGNVPRGGNLAAETSQPLSVLLGGLMTHGRRDQSRTFSLPRSDGRVPKAGS